MVEGSLSKSSFHLNNYDFLIVGAGLSGSVVAHCLASKLGSKVLVIDKREHLGGNCYDYINQHGIRVSRYGAHLFHTKKQEVWDFVQGICSWSRWEHRVLAHVKGYYVPLPVNIHTVNALLSAGITTQSQMKRWMEEESETIPLPKNSEEVALNRVGQRLYHLLFHPYTRKQWAHSPLELAPSVLSRIPVRHSFEDRYFTDPYQALPTKGYTHFFETLLGHPNITLSLNTDFFQIQKQRQQLPPVIYTGPVDHYFAQAGYPSLAYRSLRFEEEHHLCQKRLLPASVVNYPEPHIPFTRIVEYKHFLNQSSAYTTLVREYSQAQGEPFYPLPNEKNHALYKHYQALAAKEPRVFFVGRLATYKYLNMDEAISQSLDLFNRLSQHPMLAFAPK